MKRIFSLMYGLIAYAAFLPTLIYAICFVGNILVPKTIDSGAESPLFVSATLDALLLGLFAVQHSVMARQGFKRAWTKVVPRHLERPTYVLAASSMLALLLWQWRPMPEIVWQAAGFAAALLTVTFWLGWALVLGSTLLINHLELFGVQQVWGYFRGKKYAPAKFRTPILYRIVRHPLYLGFVIAFWSAPTMSLGHLVFSIATTGYILVGIQFEERDLVAEHGRAYRQYREEVPMLIPFPKASAASFADQQRS